MNIGSNIAPFIEEAPSPLMGAVAFARALMADDRATFKRGYSAQNAYLATVEALERDGSEVNRAALAECLGATP